MGNVSRRVPKASRRAPCRKNGRGNQRPTVHIATNREIGQRCKEICPFELTTKENCDVFISILSQEIVTPEYLKTRPCFNFHPGILPWYRGSGCSTWAILNGEIEAGATLHEIDKGIDTGNVIAIERFFIQPNDTAFEVFTKTEEAILKLFKNFIDKIVYGDYTSVPQTTGRTYKRSDLEAVKDLSRIKRAFNFPGKEGCFYKTYL